MDHFSAWFELVVRFSDNVSFDEDIAQRGVRLDLATLDANGCCSGSVRASATPVPELPAAAEIRNDIARNQHGTIRICWAGWLAVFGFFRRMGCRTGADHDAPIINVAEHVACNDAVSAAV